MLGVGEKFPSHSWTAAVGIEPDPQTTFKTITGLDYSGKWKVYFFWPNDFTLLCPTEIVGFSNFNQQFPRSSWIPKALSSFLYMTPGPVGRGPGDVLRILDALQSDELCPCNWHGGEPTLQIPQNQ
jgi:alkyl hydroperoxide reductase subunit AhpC